MISNTLRESAIEAIQRGETSFSLGNNTFGVSEYKDSSQLVEGSMPSFFEYDNKEYVVWII